MRLKLGKIQALIVLGFGLPISGCRAHAVAMCLEHSPAHTYTKQQYVALVSTSHSPFMPKHSTLLLGAQSMHTISAFLHISR
jgi:hypothetical protein